MPAISASAPGKAILFGEHAVVYGQPAIAVPLKRVKATAIIRPLIRESSGLVRIQAEQIRLDASLSDLPEDDPIGLAIRSTLSEAGINQPPAFNVRISSTIAIGGGLGSGAAISIAVIRAVSAFLGHSLNNEIVSRLAFQVEKLYHGNPSGIDNTVIAFERPVYFVKDESIEFIDLKEPFTLVVADTGQTTPTRETVAAVRAGWDAEPQKLDRIFAAIGKLAESARHKIEIGHSADLGQLMNENHSLLQEMGVSSSALDHLAATAQQAGALGAKLSGGGKGGNVIALVRDEDGVRIEAALIKAGATRTFVTRVQ